jgi:large subunit ribosomal protein L30
MKKLQVTLKKSPINKIDKHKRTLKALGLTRIGKTRVYPDNEALRGMIRQISYMVEVKELPDETG